MSEIKKEEIEKLAELSRISLTEDETLSFQRDITSILSFVRQVQDVEMTEEDRKMPAGIFGKLQNIYREDGEPHSGGEYSKEILANAPNKEGEYIKVKKII